MLLPALALAVQVPGPATLDPDQPPTAAIPLLVDVAPLPGGPSSALADQGTGRGQLWVDLVGPGLVNPALPGPPDGIPDLLQLNSNSPALPLGAPPAQWDSPPIGSQPAPSVVFRREANGKLSELGVQMNDADSTSGYSLQYPGASPWGIAAGDVDGDGFTDVMVACGGFNVEARNALLLAKGDGTFRYLSPEPNAPQASFTPALFDADHDGDLDYWVGNGAGGQFASWVGGPAIDPTDRFFLNDGGGGLIDATQSSGLGLASNSFSAVTTDLDLDGVQDLVVSCFKQHNKVFYGRGDGTFDFMRPEGSLGGPPLALTDMVPDPFFPGTVEFSPAQIAELESQPTLSLWSMPVDAGDFNGDGWMDLFFGTWSNQLLDDDAHSAVGAQFLPFERAYLYINLGDNDGDGRGEGRFRDATVELGIDHIGGCMGAIVADFNGDGFPDVYAGGGGPDFDRHVEEDFLYVNEPTAWPANLLADPNQPLTRAFYEVGAIAGTYQNTEMSHGVNVEPGPTGRLDLVLGNGGPALDDQGQANRYFENRSNDDGSGFEAWSFELEPKAAATAAVGARIEAVRDHGGGPGQLLVAERRATRAFSSQRLSAEYLPSGGDPLVFANVSWPSGVRSGRSFWPGGPTAGPITLSEPDTSLSIDSRPQPDGRVSLALEFTNLTGETLDAALLLLILNPVGGQLQLTGAVDIAPSVVLPDQDSVQVEAFFGQLPRGLYAVVAADRSTLEIVNESATWWDDQPVMLGALASMLADEPVQRERQLFFGRRDLSASAARLGIAVQEPGWSEQRYAREDDHTTVLPSGDQVTWIDGQLHIDLGDLPATVQDLGDGSWSLLLGAPGTCCDGPPDFAPTLLTLDAVDHIQLDDKVLRSSR